MAQNSVGGDGEGMIPDKNNDGENSVGNGDGIPYDNYDLGTAVQMMSLQVISVS